jgi:two-component system LytT family response regulator
VTTLRALVVDDEPLARQRVRRFLGREGGVEVVGECGDGAEAVKAFQDLRPELVFLDIRMPERDGFRVIDGIGAGPMPLVILVTAHREFALRAFEARVFDYLLKPFHRERFASVLARAREQIERHRAAALVARLHEPRPSYPDRLAVKGELRIQLVPTADIDYIEADGNYATVHAGAATHLVRETMNALEAELDPRQFLRVHRSLIVRLDRVVEVQPLFAGEYVLVLRDGTKLVTGRTYRDKVRQALGLA